MLQTTRGQDDVNDTPTYGVFFIVLQNCTAGVETGFALFLAKCLKGTLTLHSMINIRYGVRIEDN